jgi:hypothetical protein
MSNWNPQQLLFFFSFGSCGIKSTSYEYKNRSADIGGTITTHGNSKRFLEDLTHNNYKDIVYEEYQHINVIF